MTKGRVFNKTMNTWILKISEIVLTRQLYQAKVLYNLKVYKIKVKVYDSMKNDGIVVKTYCINMHFYPMYHLVVVVSGNDNQTANQASFQIDLHRKRFGVATYVIEESYWTTINSPLNIVELNKNKKDAM